MPSFPFSFKFAVQGVSNPFSHGGNSSPGAAPGKANSHERNNPAAMHVNHLSATADNNRTARRPASPCLAPSQPLAKKRGWVLPSAEPSVSAAADSTTGYLDTPSKYRDMAENMDQEDLDDMVADLPPPKRRRTLAGSIVSTAMSAALIGTAVGLTVYRLWRNRGKHPEALPPPPYEQGEWVPPTEQRAESSKRVAPSTPTRKQRHERRHSAAKPRPLPRSRGTPRRSMVAYTPSPAVHMPEPSLHTPSASISEFIPGSMVPAEHEEEEESNLNEHMDWMGDTLSMLIAEGRRALATEVVVMSESKEDEVDDGMGAWEDDSPFRASTSASMSVRSGRRGRPSNISLVSPPPSYSSPPVTPHRNRWDAMYASQPASAPPPPSSRPSSRRPSVSSNKSWADVHHDEDNALESPELREAMQKARQAYLQRKMLAAQAEASAGTP